MEAEMGGSKCLSLNFSGVSLKSNEKLQINTNIFSENIQIYLYIKSSWHDNNYSQLSPIFTDFFRTIYLINLRKDNVFLIYLQ